MWKTRTNDSGWTYREKKFRNGLVGIVVDHGYKVTWQVLIDDRIAVMGHASSVKEAKKLTERAAR